jgi:hypothetical protein
MYISMKILLSIDLYLGIKNAELYQELDIFHVPSNYLEFVQIFVCLHSYIICTFT